MKTLSFTPDQIDALSALTQSHIYCKSTTGNYLFMQDNMAIDLGAKSGKELLGLKDTDFISEKLAKPLSENDNAIIAYGKNQLFNEAVSIPKRPILHMLSYKIPLFDQENEICGVFGLSFLNHPTSRSHLFSQRQIFCLELISQGYGVKEVADIISISSRTVEYHIQEAKRILHARNITHLASCYTAIKTFNLFTRPQQIGIQLQGISA